MSEILQVFSSHSVWGVLSRLLLNLVFLYFLIGVVYFRFSKKEKFLFTFFLTGITVFLVSSIMNKLTIGIGGAFGLFAVFQVLRFRTRNFGVKEMAYIFSTIGISVINSVVLQIFPMMGTVLMNLVIIITAFLLELYLQKNNFKRHKIIYDKLDMLLPENYQKLLEEISQKTGRTILKVKIIEMDFKKDVARLDIFFKD